MWAQAETAVLDIMHRDAKILPLVKELEAKVISGQTSALEASAKLLEEFSELIPQVDWAN